MFYSSFSVAYYIGPICTLDGSGIVLSLFTDRFCSTPDTSGTFFAANGYSLPYSKDATKYLSSQDFYSCIDKHYYTLNNMCTSLYPLSAKCETGMKGVLVSPSTSGCNYINGIDSIQMNAIPSKAEGGIATVLAVIFFLSSVGLGYYCYKLKNRKPILSFYEPGFEGAYA